MALQDQLVLGSNSEGIVKILKLQPACFPSWKSCYRSGPRNSAEVTESYLRQFVEANTRQVLARILLFFVLLSPLSSPAQILHAQHVVVIGCDGLSPDGVRKARSPVMKRMMAQGAWSLTARGVMPTTSS